MSADNGIYIGNFANVEFRVVEASAIDNLTYPSGENASAIFNYFVDTPIFTKIEDAFVKAYEFSQNGYTEYGINVIYFSKSFADYEQEDKLNPDPYWYKDG